MIVDGRYSLNQKEWICSLFKEWILEKSEIRVNLEWTFVLFTHFGVTSGITRNPWVIPVVTPKWLNSTNVLQNHSNFTLISLFSKIHSLKSEHIHSFLFREYISWKDWCIWWKIYCVSTDDIQGGPERTQHLIIWLLISKKSVTKSNLVH